MNENEKLIQAIRKATKKACKSKKSAFKFLIDAGIIKRQRKKKKPVQSK